MRKFLFTFSMLLATIGMAVAQSSSKDTSGDIKVYNNYDFVPGQKVIFEDHFTNDQDGEYPAQWKLDRGQGVMNIINGVNAFLLTEGNYAMVSPRMKTQYYLGDTFTIEFDFLMSKAGGFGPLLRFTSSKNAIDLHIDGVGNIDDGNVHASYPGDHKPEVFRNKWHHVGIIYKNKQIKIYLDQYRVLVDPDSKIITPAWVTFAGIGSKETPIIFTNVRIAQGGGMNIIGKKFTDAKIITHGINFDYDKATLKSESMGTLNMIQKIMTGDPDVKFEVGGHTDGDGDDAYNLKLSQQRADAVRNQLITMGINGDRLTAKGYGKTKPIDDNATEEGKANNRRVEFVKK